MTLKTGIIGCGNMGGGMARTLQASQHSVVCHDPSHTAMRALEADGVALCGSIEELAAQADILILSLPTATIVESVMERAHTAVRPGTVVVDTSTSKPGTSQHLSANAQGRGYHFLDAPVSGGASAAGSGTMTMLVGGSQEALDLARPVLDVLSARLVHVGESGAGHAAKIANNMLCAANLVLVGEALRLAEASGVKPSALLDGINAGSGRSAVSEVNFPRWILNDQYDSGFTMGLMRKDVALALELATHNATDLDGFKGIAQLWENSAEALADTEDFNRIAMYRGADNE